MFVNCWVHWTKCFDNVESEQAVIASTNNQRSPLQSLPDTASITLEACVNDLSYKI